MSEPKTYNVQLTLEELEKLDGKVSDKALIYFVIGLILEQEDYEGGRRRMKIKKQWKASSKPRRKSLENLAGKWNSNIEVTIIDLWSFI